MSEADLPISKPRAWVEIVTENLRGNVARAREVSGCAIMAVVKAGAYGHGLEDVARILEAEDVEFLGVANIGEARRIREAGVKGRIYLLGATWEGEREEIVARNVTPCVSSLEEAGVFGMIARRYGVTLPVHISVDTGMGRGGFLPDEILRDIAALREIEGLEVEGMGSHLSSSDEDEEFTRQQMASFEKSVADLGGTESFKWLHLSNSGGILGYAPGSSNLARPGLMVYGISPIAEFQAKLRNVMTLKSRVTLVRTVPAGHGISYGRTFVTEKPTRVATIGIGYGDGYPRHVSGKGAEVFIKGRRYPILGRVTMDQLMVKLPDQSDVAIGDEVEMFGENISVAEVAEKADSIAWEIFTGITPRVQRVYL